MQPYWARTHSGGKNVPSVMTSSSSRPYARQQKLPQYLPWHNSHQKKAAITTTLVVQKAKETAVNAVDSYYNQKTEKK
jgi:hypothetical protein